MTDLGKFLFAIFFRHPSARCAQFPAQEGDYRKMEMDLRRNSPQNSPSVRVLLSSFTPWVHHHVVAARMPRWTPAVRVYIHTSRPVQQESRWSVCVWNSWVKLGQTPKLFLKYENKDGSQHPGQFNKRKKPEFTRRKQEVSLIQVGKGR